MLSAKKCFLAAFAVLMAAMLFASCAHVHTWSEATCTEPKTCTECGEIIGKELGHDWQEATCTSPKTCSRCGQTDGEPLGHEWKDATCTESKTCSRCGSTEGEPMSHEWIEATCTESKKCSRCGVSEGEALGHDAPTVSCTEGGTCSRCGAEIPALGHEWIEATCTEPKKCSRCGSTEGGALGHEASTPVRENEKSATCTEAGHYDEVVYCSRCNAELSRETKTEPALGHSVSNGVCSRCGYEVYETVKGHGDDVITGINVGDGLYKVHFVNSGKRNFIVWVYDSNDDRDLAVNEIGKYDGYYFLTGDAPFLFEIKSSGDWSFTIERLSETAVTSFEGKGSYVTDIFSADSGVWHFTHTGKSNFVVWLYTTDGRDLLVNEIGKYDGKKLLPIPSGSNAIMVIEADGNWTASPVD